MLQERLHPGWMRELDHTADVGVEVEASGPRELFERAAYAMFWLLADVEAAGPDVRIPVRVDAGDREELMVNWLSELNYRHQVDRIVFSRFEVADLSDRSINAVASGAVIAHGLPAVFCELKGVTYHDLVVKCGDAGCRASIIFDI